MACTIGIKLRGFTVVEMWSSRLYKLLKLNHTEQYHVIYSGSRLSKPRTGSAANDQHQNCIEGSLYFNNGVQPTLVDNTSSRRLLLLLIRVIWVKYHKYTIKHMVTIGFKILGIAFCILCFYLCCKLLD